MFNSSPHRAAISLRSRVNALKDEIRLIWPDIIRCFHQHQQDELRDIASRLLDDLEAMRRDLDTTPADDEDTQPLPVYRKEDME